jgi:hypothetical protein
MKNLIILLIIVIVIKDPERKKIAYERETSAYYIKVQ